MTSLVKSLNARFPEGSKSLLAALTTGHLVNDFYSLVFPFLLPILITTFNLSYLQAGVLALARSFLAGPLQPVVGYLADNFGIRKGVILAGFFAFALGFGLLGLASGYTMLLFACLIISLGESTFHAQSTNFITHSFAKAKGQAMGLHGLGGSLGNFAAPVAVTFLISLYGWQIGSQLLAIPGLIVIVILGLTLTEPARVARQGFWGGMNMPLVLLALNFGLIFMLYKGFLTFLPTFLVERGSTITEAGSISAVMFLVGMLAQPGGGYLYDRWGGRTLLIISAVGVSLSLWLFTISQGIILMLAIILIGAFIFALFPVTLAMASDLAEPGQVGIGVGLVFGLSGMLSAVTPVITGYAADTFGLSLAFKLLIILPCLSILLSVLTRPSESQA